MRRSRRMHRGQGEKEHDVITRDRQGTGPPVEASRGGRADGRMVEAGRDKKVPLDSKTVGPTGT